MLLVSTVQEKRPWAILSRVDRIWRPSPERAEFVLFRRIGLVMGRLCRRTRPILSWTRSETRIRPSHVGGFSIKECR